MVDWDVAVGLDGWLIEEVRSDGWLYRIALVENIRLYGWLTRVKVFGPKWLLGQRDCL